MIFREFSWLQICRWSFVNFHSPQLPRKINQKTKKISIRFWFLPKFLHSHDNYFLRSNCCITKIASSVLTHFDWIPPIWEVCEYDSWIFLGFFMHVSCFKNCCFDDLAVITKRCDEQLVIVKLTFLMRHVKTGVTITITKLLVCYCRQFFSSLFLRSGSPDANFHDKQLFSNL